MGKIQTAQNSEIGHYGRRAKISKVGRRRLVPILPALRSFLQPLAKSEGHIIPLTCNGLPAYQNAWERSVKAAGLWPWCPNRLRDSFVSYRYEHTGSAELTAKEAGHSVAIMLDRYQKVVSRGAAEKFWGIRPALHSPLFSILSSSIRSGDSPESQMKLKAMLRERIARIDFDFTPVFNDDGTVVYHQRDGAGRFLDLAGYQFSEKAGPVVRVQFTNKADRCVVLDDDKAMLLRPE